MAASDDPPGKPVVRITKSKPAPVTLEEAARILPALSRCPDHPQWITLPLFGVRTCCLLAVVEALKVGKVQEALQLASKMMSKIGKVTAHPALQDGIRKTTDE